MFRSLDVILGRHVPAMQPTRDQLRCSVSGSKQQRSPAKQWRSVAATAVHYINDVLADMADFDTTNNVFADTDNFKDLAKHWGEMKGFALGLQFSPWSPFAADKLSATS